MSGAFVLSDALASVVSIPGRWDLLSRFRVGSRRLRRLLRFDVACDAHHDVAEFQLAIWWHPWRRRVVTARPYTSRHSQPCKSLDAQSFWRQKCGRPPARTFITDARWPNEEHGRGPRCRDGYWSMAGNGSHRWAFISVLLKIENVVVAAWRDCRRNGGYRRLLRVDGIKVHPLMPYQRPRGCGLGASKRQPGAGRHARGCSNSKGSPGP
jgi:hypothetical protein